jgi:hypothetical protein
MSAAVLFFAFLLAIAGDRPVAQEQAPDTTLRSGVARADTNGLATGPAGAADDRTPVPDTLRKMANAAYSGGEYLKFDVHWSFMSVGDAYLVVTDTLYQGRKCNIVTFRLESKPFFDMFYKVRDRYRTIIDADGLFPWRFEQQIREGGFSRDFTAEFDQRAGVATTTGGTYPIPPYVQDIMSAFYYARVIDYVKFHPGQRIELQNFYKDSTYPLGVKYKGRQRIEVDAGTFDCIIVEPLVTEGGLFKSEGRILLWITDDDRKMPVRVRAEIPIGSVDSDLTEYRGLNGPLRARIEDD